MLKKDVIFFHSKMFHTSEDVRPNRFSTDFNNCFLSDRKQHARDSLPPDIFDSILFLQIK